MFKDTPEGSTLHHKDTYYKCGICGDRFFTEDQAKNCNHDYSMIPPNAQRTGDLGRLDYNQIIENKKSIITKKKK